MQEMRNKLELRKTLQSYFISNFCKFVGSGFKSVFIVIWEYRRNLSKLFEVFRELRYSFQNYETFYSIILKIIMILDFFKKTRVFRTEKKSFNMRYKEKDFLCPKKPAKDKWTGYKKFENFDAWKHQEEVTKKVKELLCEAGQKDTSFLDKKFRNFEYMKRGMPHSPHKGS